MTQYIDYLGNPITEGDIYIHPVGAGSSSATLNIGKVEEIIPIVKVPTSYGEKWTLQEYAGRTSPTEYRPFGTWRRTGPDPYKDREWEPDMQRAYVIRARALDRRYVGNDRSYRQEDYAWRWADGKRGSIIKNIDRIVVVTSMLGDLWAARVDEADTLAVNQAR